MDKKSLPVIAMRGLTVFPNTSLHFDVGREISINALKFALKNEGEIILISQKNPNVLEPTVDDLETVGTLALIKHALPTASEDMRVLIDGIKRVKVTSFTSTEPFFMVEYEEYDAPDEDKIVLEAMKREVVSLIKEINAVNPAMNKEVLLNVINEEDITLFIDKTSNIFGGKHQQELLSERDNTKRLDILIDTLKEELEIAKIDKIISLKVNKAIDNNQKEFYLREQLKAITEELGEDDDGDKLEEKIKALPLEEEYITKLLKDLARSKKMPNISPEYSIIRSYLEFVTELPWTNETVDNTSLVAAKKVLDKDHYGLVDIKDRIIEFLAVRSLSKERKEPIVCLVGPPGVGKTSIVQSIAKAMNRKYIRMSVGGMRDEAEIRGHRKTYVGAMAGRILTNLKLAGTKNPVFLIDEIDKLASDYKGDPSSALLEVLDPEQNNAFRDNYLEVPFDLSNVLFITTANSLQTIPSPLLDRMEVIEMSGYTPLEKEQIAIRHLIPKQMKANGLDENEVKISKNAVCKIIEEYTAESGVRGLEKQISKLLRKLAKEKVELAEKGKNFKKNITENSVSKYLGIETNRQRKLIKNAEIGRATGLAWTSVGGEVLTIEAIALKGKGDIVLTGKLGEVMQESAKIGVSYVKKHASRYGLNEEDFAKTDIHIHVPEGAVPKDGPSAGITIATAVLSALSGKKVRGDVSMTGEITLRGNVLAIGGLKEKTLASHRNGIYEVILPKENKKDVNELPELIKRTIKFDYVETLEDVFNVVFEK
ncbi:MAG: endopeptidase La [Eubacteriales bacterium]|nr:endopeptidase La [Eubacteriales bacterium]